MDAAAVMTQIEDLLKAHAAYMAKPSANRVTEQTELIVRVEAAIERLAPRSSRYAQEAETFRRHQGRARMVHLAGILQALKEDVNAGWLKTVEELVHADTFSDFLDQARELNSKATKMPLLSSPARS